MKKINILFIAILALLASCSPRVKDVFEDTAAERLEQNRLAVKERLMGAENGWVMQYFADYDYTASAVDNHKGYTFLMLFREDGTVTVGAPVDGVYKTETSLWDVISDNSTVLTFNTFNSIFHLYSNPDPDLGLWGADGIGYGGDYEFSVLEYNTKENYQLLKGKKRSCYIRLYPLATNEDWEGYFAKLDAMDKFLFTDDVPWDMYVDDQHLTLYNAKKHEVRAFEAGADTLGGGHYYGLITTENGIRFHDAQILEAKVERASFNLSGDKKRLVSVVNPNAYITVEGATVFTSDANNGKPWIVDMNKLPTDIIDKAKVVNENMSAVASNSYIKSYSFYGAGKNRMALRINYSISGDAGNSYSQYYFDAVQEDRHITLTADSTYMSGAIIHNYNGWDLITAFNGTYDIDLAIGFTPSKGIELTKGADFVLTMKH